MKDEGTPVTQALDGLGVAYRVFRHPGPVHSLEQAAAERGQRPQQVVRSIVFRLGADEFLMALVAGPQQISWPALRQYLGRTRVSMASADEVLAVTGYQLGAVSPFGLPRPLPVVVDRSVLAEDEVSLGSGVRGTTIILATADLMAALGDVPVAELSEETGKSAGDADERR
jgi:Cys-tRNA(Pro)/Cys-tRNA(Cys) deacylase